VKGWCPGPLDDGGLFKQDNNIILYRIINCQE
jgi:hypothetical protein